MRRSTVLLSAVVSLSLFACNNDPAKDKAKAQVSEAVAAAQPAARGANTYRFSAADSRISFVGAKVSGKHDGVIGAFTGTVQGPGDDPTKGTVTVEIDMSTLSVDDPKLTGQLKSPDFFDVAKFPAAKFTSASIRPGGENGASYTVTGNLELHGVTKAITFPANIRMTPSTVDVDAEFSINRKDFAVVYPGMPDDLIKDQVLIKLAIHGKPAPA